MPVHKDLRIEIVLMMAKLEYPTLVRRHFQRENLSYIPSKNTIRAIFNKFVQTGSIDDRERSERPPTATTEKVEEIAEVLADTPVSTVHNVSRAVDVSKSVAHRVMRAVLGFKLYKMHLTQQLYDDDKGLRVEMAKLLLPIISDQGLIFFQMKQRFALQE